MSEDYELSGRSVESGEGISVTIRGERVAEVRRCPADPITPYLSSGFLDMQVNGCAGLDYSAERLEEAHVEGILRVLASSGTTRHVPTFVTGPGERLQAGLSALSGAMERDPWLAAAIPGVHIEGPYISGEEGPRGAHDPRYTRDPDYGEFASWQEASGGRIRIVTLAPERKGALEFIERITREGVIAAIGHTAASPERIREAVQAGATLSTHLGNGSHGMIPRLRNYIWEQLAEDRLHAGIIADGFHLPPAVLTVILRAKGLERLILVSDAAVMSGRAPGVYEWGAVRVQVFADGHLGLAGTEYLAGAGHFLDRGVAQLARSTGCTLAEALRPCTANPAALLGLQPVHPEPAPGLPADLTLFHWNPGDEALTIEKTLLQGRLAYSREACTR